MGIGFVRRKADGMEARKGQTGRGIVIARLAGRLAAGGASKDH